jgi:hypothetical protein
MRKLLFLILLAFFVVILSGCLNTGGGLAPSTMPITGKDSYTVVKRDVTGADWSISIIGIPLIPCSAYTALQNAKKANSADALINVTAENKFIYLFFINWQKMMIRGDAIKFERGGEW